MNLILRYNEMRRKNRQQCEAEAALLLENIWKVTNQTIRMVARQPMNPEAGELFIDTETNTCKVWTGDRWHTIGGAS